MENLPTTGHRPGQPQSDAERWQAVCNRDPAADGLFVYAVKTTGIYCRVTCPARLPGRDNVSFHADSKAAEAAGYRPCRRCRPDGPSPLEQRRERITATCRMIEQSDQPPKLDELAAAAGLSRFHFHRVFRRQVGLTPGQYASACRAQRVRRALDQSERVTDAIYAAGFNTASRFYEAAPGDLGMQPGAYLEGGRDARIRFAAGECSLGSVVVAATGIGVCFIGLGDEPDVLVRELQDRFPKAELIGADPAFEQLVARVVGMIDDPAGAGPVSLPLDVRGTAFQHKVWNALRAIEPGRTSTYADIASAIGQPGAARAVARACAANPLAVAIPCHRVVRSDGTLSGYRWGVARKRALLDREKET